MAEDSEQEVRITYETLYEILRREKSHAELQNLDESFFKDVIEYLGEKNKILQEAAGKFDMFSVDERDNTQVQINNVRRILKELYERREKKIIEMALNKSRTNSSIIDTANLLEKETIMYNALIQVLDGFRKDILIALLEMRGIVQSARQEEPKAAEPIGSPVGSSVGDSVGDKADSMPEPEPKPVIAPEPQAEAKSTKKIKFTQKVDQFVGPDLDLIGPFEPEQEEELPSEIADILIGKGSAIIAE